jgi:8-oxo-dGTP pyrophosphatase MutT (NUDIX family)
LTTHLDAGSPSRDFTVAVLVVSEGRVLLHRHRRLDRWLPPGGHIEQDELPDEAALREVREETGVAAILWPERGIDIDLAGQPRQLCRPAGVQLTDIGPDHQHIDLIYFASAGAYPASLPPDVGWFAPDEWSALGLTEEVAAWCTKAVALIEGSPTSSERPP